MTIQYFEDADTLYVVLKNRDVAETWDLDEHTLMEFDARGSLVPMTIEHARERAELPNFSFQRVAAGTPVQGAIVSMVPQSCPPSPGPPRLEKTPVAIHPLLQGGEGR